MSKTILAKVSGFTPVIDAILDQHGAITALVFGKVWRYCQMSDGVCTASQKRIADELGIARKTVNESIDALVTNGYLRDLTPGLLGSTHKYQDTGKASFKSSITAGVTESYNQPNEPVTVGYTPCNPELQPPVTVGYTKIDSKIQEETSIADVNVSKPAPEPKQRKRKEPTPEQIERTQAEQAIAEHFQNVTKLHIPKEATKSDYATAQIRWWKPIKAILQQTNYNVEAAQFCVDTAISKMRKDRLTISAPQSILNNALSVYQEQEAL